jgi:hypothetical protein
VSPELKAGIEAARGADGWVLQVVRLGWTIAIAPIDGRGAPFRVSVSSPAGAERFHASNVKTVEEAMRKSVTFLDAERVEVNRIELERIGWAMDRTAL